MGWVGSLDVPGPLGNGERISGLVITDPYKWGQHWGDIIH